MLDHGGSAARMIERMPQRTAAAEAESMRGRADVDADAADSDMTSRARERPSRARRCVAPAATDVWLRMDGRPLPPHSHMAGSWKEALALGRHVEMQEAGAQWRVCVMRVAGEDGQSPEAFESQVESGATCARGGSRMLLLAYVAKHDKLNTKMEWEASADCGGASWLCGEDITDEMWRAACRDGQANARVLRGLDPSCWWPRTRKPFRVDDEIVSKQLLGITFSDDRVASSECKTASSGSVPGLIMLASPLSSCSSSSSSSYSSSDSSSDSSSNSSDEEDRKASDHEPPPTNESNDTGANGDDDDGSSSDSSSDISSSSSSSDNETGADESEKEPEEEDTSSSESEVSEPEGAYPPLPPAPIDAVIAVRKKAKQRSLQISPVEKVEVVLLARQHQLQRLQGKRSKSKKKRPSRSKSKTGVLPAPTPSSTAPLAGPVPVPLPAVPLLAAVAPIPGAAVATNGDSWFFDCSCGIQGDNYDDCTAMVQCDKCSHWSHVACNAQPVSETFSCFRCIAIPSAEPAEEWLFDCPCGIKQKNYDDGGMMVQCDKCDVWQHGLCVGLKPEDGPPESFQCLRCQSKQRGSRNRKRKASPRTRKTRTKKSSGKDESEVNEAAMVDVPVEPKVAVSLTSAAMSMPPPPPQLSPPPSPPSTPPPPPPLAASGTDALTPPQIPTKRRQARRRTQVKKKEASSSSQELSPSVAADPSRLSLSSPSQSQPLVIRPPLPSSPKGSAGGTPTNASTQKRKPSSARDRLAKKLKIKQYRG